MAPSQANSPLVILWPLLRHHRTPMQRVASRMAPGCRESPARSCLQAMRTGYLCWKGSAASPQRHLDTAATMSSCCAWSCLLGEAHWCFQDDAAWNLCVSMASASVICPQVIIGILNNASWWSVHGLRQGRVSQAEHLYRDACSAEHPCSAVVVSHAPEDTRDLLWLFIVGR